MTRLSPLVVIYATVALDAAGIALIFPILPPLLRALSGRQDVAGMIGALLALYSLIQFVLAPLLGALADRFGRRPVLLLSLVGAMADNVIMATTPWVWPVFVARALAGVTAATATIATAVIADVTPDADRARRFGLCQACFGAGFVLGPVIGGVLADISPRDPFIAAAAVNGLNLVIAWRLFPETRPAGHAPVPWEMLNPLAPLRWLSAFPALVPLLAAGVLIGLTGQSYGTMWVLFVEDRFAWTATEVGLSLGVFGALVGLVQGTGVAPVIRCIGERGALLLGLGCEVLALLCFAFASHGWMVFATIPLLAFGGVALPALRAMLTNAVDTDRQGQLQGVATSLGSLVAIAGPLLFSWVYAASPPDGEGNVWLVAATICMLAIPITLAARVPSSTSSIPPP